jgi:hypothetical protein
MLMLVLLAADEPVPAVVSAKAKPSTRSAARRAPYRRRAIKSRSIRSSLCGSVGFGDSRERAARTDRPNLLSRRRFLKARLPLLDCDEFH